MVVSDADERTGETDPARLSEELSARKGHAVVSGIWLCRDGLEAVSHAVTSVEFAPLTDPEITSYIASGEPFGKAGAYAIQGLASSFIRGIDGDYFNVVGLPVNRMCDLYRSTFGGELVLRG